MKIKKSSNGDRLMIIIGLLMSLPFGILFLKNTYSDYRLKTKGIETVGTVTNSKVEYRIEDTAHYSISLKYDCGSNKGIEKDDISVSTTYYNIGDNIVLYCDEDEPGKFIFKEEESFVGMLGLILVFFVPGFIIFLVGVKRVLSQSKVRKESKELAQFRTKVEATIIDIYQSNIRFDKKLGFKIVAQYGNDVFKSEDIYADIYYILDLGDKIDVYIDDIDHSKYWMDVDSILKKNYKELNVVTNKKGDELIIYGIIVLIMSILFMYQNGLDLTSRLSLFIILLFIVAICLIGFGVKRVIKQKNREKLEQSGTKVEATILLELAIPITPKEQDRYKLVDYKYKIVAKYNKETFLSDEYSKSIKIKKGAKIDVYLDESDHSKYWVDIDSISETNNDNTMIIN